MNGNKDGGAEARITRTIQVAPTTRAIRVALAVSATLLALSGSGAALAGTCAITALNTVSCNGVFVDTLPGVEFIPTVDMTLVLGDTLPTSVTPAAGIVGVDGTWGGSVSIISYADVTTDGADGVFVDGNSTATVTNHGAIATDHIAIHTGTGADTVRLVAGSTTTGGSSSPASDCAAGVALAICTGDNDDTVDVEETATVNGVIDGGAGTDTLIFRFLTPADLAGQSPASGTVTHDGRTYTWVNFEALEAVQPLVSIGDLSQAEGTGGSTTFTFLLTRSGDLPAGSVLVSTVDGSAVSPGDFAAQANVLVNFANGQPSATFDVTVVADPAVEPDEGFQVVLSSPIGMEIDDGTGDGTILNDDAFFVTEIPALGNAGLVLLAATLCAAALLVLRRVGTGG